MTDHAHWLAILRIGHTTSRHGEGLSMREALARTRYSDLRTDFEAGDLLPLIQAHPELVEEWLAYSREKPTTGGWYLKEDEIGQVGYPQLQKSFDSLDRAVAEYVVRELDFWAGFEGRG